MIQAEVVHHSLAKILSQATVDLPPVGSELRLAGQVSDRLLASKFYAFLNDENRPPTTSIVDALRNYDIVPVLWSRRDEVRQELAARARSREGLARS